MDNTIKLLVNITDGHKNRKISPPPQSRSTFIRPDNKHGRVQDENEKWYDRCAWDRLCTICSCFPRYDNLRSMFVTGSHPTTGLQQPKTVSDSSANVLDWQREVIISDSRWSIEIRRSETHAERCLTRMRLATTSLDPLGTPVESPMTQKWCYVSPAPVRDPALASSRKWNGPPRNLCQSSRSSCLTLAGLNRNHLESHPHNIDVKKLD